MDLDSFGNFDFGNMSEADIERELAMYQGLLTPPEDAEYDALREKHWRILIIILYLLVIVMGFCENFLVMFVIIKNKHLQTVTNIFIANLAMSDIGMCLFNLPFQLHYQLTNQWIFGPVLCQIIVPMFGVPIYVSTMSMLTIAIDRYFLLVFPFKKRLSNKGAFIIISVIAMLAVGPAIPVVVFTKYKDLTEPIFNFKKVLCMEVWPYPKYRKIYSAVLFVLQFCLPILTSSVIYSIIYYVLKKRPLKKSERKSRRTNKILLSIVLLFTLCWLPWNIFTLVYEFHPKCVTGKYFNLVDLFLKLFAFASTCINPFLYGWLNDNFRKEFDAIIGRVSKRTRGSQSTRFSQSLSPLETSRILQAPVTERLMTSQAV